MSKVILLVASWLQGKYLKINEIYQYGSVRGPMRWARLAGERNDK